MSEQKEKFAELKKVMRDTRSKASVDARVATRRVILAAGAMMAGVHRGALSTTLATYRRLPHSTPIFDDTQSQYVLACAGPACSCVAPKRCGSRKRRN